MATYTQDVKKAIGLLRKQQLFSFTLFCTFLYCPCATTTWKCLTASFMEDVNKRRRMSFSLCKLECGPQEINSREIRLRLPFPANWNKRRRKRLKKREFILKLTFSLVFAAVAVVDAKAPWLYTSGGGAKEKKVGVGVGAGAFTLLEEA